MDWVAPISCALLVVIAGKWMARRRHQEVAMAAASGGAVQSPEH